VQIPALKQRKQQLMLKHLPSEMSNQSICFFRYVSLLQNYSPGACGENMKSSIFSIKGLGLGTCGGLTLAGCQMPTQQLPHSPSSSGQGEEIG